MRILSIFLTLTILIAGVPSCAEPIADEPVQRNLTVSSSDGGSVTTPGEDTFAYEEGAAVDLVATADDGYRFVNWTGDVDTIVDVEAASTTITMNGDYEIMANFEEAHDLTVSSTEGGSVTTPGEGVFTYEAGAVVSLVATPASGHRFANWTGDVDTIADVEAASTTITINGDYSITANFVAQYDLTISSTEGGDVTAPGQGTFTYDAGTVVNLVAEADEGYTFMEWTGDVGSVTDVTAASTTVTMNSGYTITAGFAKEVRTWHDLHAIRDNLSGHYVLMNDLDSTTPGYAELAGTTANDGKGWQPIGTDERQFAGSFDGHGYEIRDPFINRPDENDVGLFGSIAVGAVVTDIGLADFDFIGHHVVGGLVGCNWRGHVNNSHSAGSVTGDGRVGGLVGFNMGTVSNSYSISSVTGNGAIGGLVGENWWGTVSNSYYNYDEVLLNGENIISIGALMGDDFEQWLANDKYLDVDDRLSQEDGYYLVNDVDDFRELLAFGQDASLRFKLKKDLDLSNEANFYVPYLAGEFHGNGHKISNLSFSFGFALHVGLFGTTDSGGRVSDLGVENADIVGGGYVGCVVGTNRGTVSNSYSSGSVRGDSAVGGLVGRNGGTVSDSYSISSVMGKDSVGGLVGDNYGSTVSNSYSIGSVTGEWSVGGLVGLNHAGTVSNSYYDYDEALINGENVITIGALLNEDFDEWLANNKSLNVNERLSQEEGYYLINDVSEFRQLLVFGQDGSLRFRLQDDLDLGDAPNLYVPYLAGEFDGGGHSISNLSFTFSSVSQVGLFGYLASGGRVSGLVLESANIIGHRDVGGLVGFNDRGTVSNSYSTGGVIGYWGVGGLVGSNYRGTVSRSCFTGSVTGYGYGYVGGLVGSNVGTVSNCHSAGVVTGYGYGFVGGLVGHNEGTVNNAYSTGAVTGGKHVGGLVGINSGGTVRYSYSTGMVDGEDYVGGLIGWNAADGIIANSFWDVEASGMEESNGGTGKSTTEMMGIATFADTETEGLDETWDIVAVASDETNPAYIWNIVDGQTYPFLSWQPVS